MDSQPAALEVRTAERLRVFFRLVNEGTREEEPKKYELDPSVLRDILGLFKRFRFEDGRYRIQATKGVETTSLEHTVRVPAPPSVPDSGATILRATIEPRGAIALPYGEPVEVRFLGTAGGEATLRLPHGKIVTLSERPLGRSTPDAANFQRTSGRISIKCSWCSGI